MRVKKSPGLISPTGVIKLMTHAMMGAALGLGFSLALILSNPAIARRLYLSRPTVASHVAHILTKLGFSSRAQIAAWAAQRRAPAP